MLAMAARTTNHIIIITESVENFAAQREARWKAVC